MKLPLKIILWLLPVLGLGLGFAWAYARFNGLFETWRFLGNPGETIVRILGIQDSRRILVATDTGSLYALEFGQGDGVALPAQPEWDAEPLDTVDPFPRVGLGAYYVTWPAPFSVQQIFEREYVYKVEGVGRVMFGLASDGNLWMWYHQNAGLASLVFYFYPVMGLVVGLVAALSTYLVLRAYPKMIRSHPV